MIYRRGVVGPLDRVRGDDLDGAEGQLRDLSVVVAVAVVQ